MSKTAKIILKLRVCVFLNILLKTVILNYSTTWLLTPTLSKNYTITCLAGPIALSGPLKWSVRSLGQTHRGPRNHALDGVELR